MILKLIPDTSVSELGAFDTAGFSCSPSVVGTSRFSCQVYSGNPKWVLMNGQPAHGCKQVRPEEGVPSLAVPEKTQQDFIPETCHSLDLKQPERNSNQKSGPSLAAQGPPFWTTPRRVGLDFASEHSPKGNLLRLGSSEWALTNGLQDATHIVLWWDRSNPRNPQQSTKCCWILGLLGLQ